MKAAVVHVLLLWLCCAAFADDWQTVRDCRLLKNESNDGDSFHIEADGEEKVVRLYFVDAPETDKAGLVSERVTEQAKEFGIDEKETVEIGKKAAAFTRSVLSRPFTILTRGQRAMGASKIPREYAFVETADGEDLGEMLVARGLGRSFGEDASTSSDSAKKLREKYDRLEKEAREQSLGAWGDGAATPTIALGNSKDDSLAANAPLRPIVDDSDEITANAVSSAVAYASEGAVARQQAAGDIVESTASGKVSLNNATLEELEALPDIGPKTAQAIIAGRPYAKVEDIDRVEGIGPKTLQAILPYLVE